MQLLPEIPPNVFHDAVRAFWDTRLAQAEAQRLRGMTDQGTRGAVTGGQQMNGFLRVVVDHLMSVGVPESDIYLKNTELPGYFRPTKDWDLVVMSSQQLVAAIEFKSQVGPSLGNNFNNRTEEAIGNAVDIWTAYREGAFAMSPAPWLGYLFLLEDSPRSRTPVQVAEPHFQVFDEFRGASYAKRYELLCRRLVLERHYSAACFLLTDRDLAAEAVNCTEPAEDLSGDLFLSQLLRHAAR
jgi:Restriction endonuclease XhoI